MKEVTVGVPDDKRAEWVNGVLTLVDDVEEARKDDRPVTERIKTFKDALRVLGTPEEEISDDFFKEYEKLGKDVVAYLKLRVITEALNEGWKPQFTTNEYRWFPWFELFNQKELDDMDDEKKSRVVLRSCFDASTVGGVAYVDANVDSSNTGTSYGSRLAFKTQELAKYAGKQFLDIWADYVFKPKEKE